MPRLLIIVFVVFVSFVSRIEAQVLAFPEAEGFGRYATGARTNLSAASVYHVTNLNDSGSGSLRDALSQPNRFVVFDVGGIINLNSVLTVASNITIAGQTAPGGIQVYGNRVAFHGANNLVSRHWAVRMGSAPGRVDAASIVRGTNMMYDHMSITWGVDGTFDINPDSGQVIDDITIQNSIIGQGLDVVGHSTGGLMTLGDGRKFSIIKSLFADNVTRNPKVRGENEFINNVVYGYESSGYIMGDTTATSHANVQGNYFIEGPVNGSSPFASGTSSFHIYANDNWVDDNRNGVLDGALNTNYPGANVVGTPHAFPTLPSMTAQQAVSYVMENAGPSIIRDKVDTRLMQEVASYGTLGGVIIRESDLFPNYGTNPIYRNPRARFLDADNDGMADNWELSRGLSPANNADWKNLNLGYTRLEEYINELGAIGTTQTTAQAGPWTSASTWGGTVPTLADDVNTTQAVTLSAGQAFARRINVGGSLALNEGTLDVFDTATFAGTSTIGSGLGGLGATLTAGRVLIGPTGQSGTLAVDSGGTLQTGTVASAGGTALLSLNGGTFRAAGVPDISVPTSLGVSGGTFDTASYSGVISGSISGSGRFRKVGAGTLTLSGAKTYNGPTQIDAGQVVVTGSPLSQTSGVSLASGTTLNVSAVGGLNLSTGKTLTGAGNIVGNVSAGSGAVVIPQGEIQPIAQVVAIQAEDLSLGSDWAIFDNAQHGTGVGGSYDGSDLNGGGIVLLSNVGGTVPVATGIASTLVTIPATKTYYLFARTAEPAVSPIPGDPATQPGGNNSFFASAQANSLIATPSNYEEVQTYANPGNQAVWNLVSPSLSPLAGVSPPLNAGIDYSLTSGLQQFAVYGREVGTILDGFVLSDTNLTAAQLDQALSGQIPGEERVMTITGNYQHSVGASLQVEIAGGTTLNKLAVTGTAQLLGDLSISLASGFVPQSSQTFSILGAGTLVGQFANVADGSRIAIANGGGSFAIDYDYANGRVLLSNYLAGMAGDFDGDGDVDGRDFLVWQRNPSVGDLADWQMNYGVNSLNATSTAVPEPAAWLLASLAICCCVIKRV